MTDPSKIRPIIVVDLETSGLNPKTHSAVEVAWWNLTTDERGCFIPPHDVSKVLAAAEIKALQINRYIDRIADQPQDVDHREAERLLTQFRGYKHFPPEPLPQAATLLGANPRIDAEFLRRVLSVGGREPWHYRLWDISAYAAGVLNLDYVPGLWDICEALDIEHNDHTAEGDVTATGLCFKELRAMAQFHQNA